LALVRDARQFTGFFRESVRVSSGRAS
jgi:hypothetical protein